MKLAIFFSKNLNRFYWLNRQQSINSDLYLFLPMVYGGKVYFAEVFLDKKLIVLKALLELTCKIRELNCEKLILK